MYIGIDLGTTNSVISFSESKSDGRVVANPISIERYTAAGFDYKGNVKYTIGRDKTLPSCVYYKNGEVIVGDYAREQYKKYPENVVKSVKSQMGNAVLTGGSSEITDKTPEEVSARILSHLRRKSEIQYRKKIEDVIITVPANFDAGQREATMKAAELAGFSVNNPDGSRKQILISEPNAVLYDIAQKIMNGEVSSSVLDLSSKKKVLVFDIGGGTLDVTFHEIERDSENPDKLNIAEIATSRYMQLAGDDFDTAIAQCLYDRYIENLKKYDPSSVGKVQKSKAMVLKLLSVAAEQLKMDMSMNAQSIYAEDDDWFGENTADADGEYTADVSHSIGDERICNDSVTRTEFEEMIAPFMGNEYKYEDYKGYSQNKKIDRKNIIAPILDALEKADRYYKRNSSEEMKVDAVILNGGMSKLYLIKDRLQTFFQMEPITTADPDLSVANGAAVYACIFAEMNAFNANGDTDNRRKKLIEIVRHIQNDSLYIGLSGGASELLIAEGTELPYSTEITGFKMNAGSNTVEIPIKRGVTIGEMPVIARGKITFDKSIKETSEVKIEANFDTTGLISIKAHLVSEVGTLLETGTVEVAVGEDASAKIKGQTVKIRPRNGSPINASNYLHNLSNLYTGKKKKINFQNRVNDILEDIENCGNPEDFEEKTLELLNTTKKGGFLVKLFQIATSLCESWSAAGKKELVKIAECTINNNVMATDSVGKAIYDYSVEIVSNITMTS